MLIALLIELLVISVVQAQDFPARPIRLIVPFSPGGITDTSARVIGQHMGASVGQQIVVDNRGGAGSTIGADLVAKSTPDGYTLLFTDVTTHAINASLYTKLPYDTLKDFSMVLMTGASPLFLATHPSVPARSLAELVAHAKAKPGTINYASAGAGSTLHLAAELFRSAAGIQIVHVPYKGAGAAMGSLLSGEVVMVFSAAPPILPHVKTGALRAVAVTSPTRTSIMPELPTVAESFPGFQIYIVNGILGPAGIPAAVVSRLGAEFAKAIAKPEVRQRLETLGAEPRTGSPAELGAFIKAETARFGKLIRETGIKAE